MLEARDERMFPTMLKMRDEAWRHEQVGSRLPRDLIRDEDLAALDVARVNNHDWHRA
jgi:hypothetical protein